MINRGLKPVVNEDKRWWASAQWER